MIEGKWFQPGADIAEAEGIRKIVFGKGQDALDQESWNVVVYHEGQPAATGRIWWKEDAFWLGDLAVLPQIRRRKLGDLTLRLLLFKAETHAARMIRLCTPADTTPFFARLGFREIARQNETITMELLGSELCLDTCKSCNKDCANRKSE